MEERVAGSSGTGRREKAHLDGLDGRLCITVPEAAEMLGISRNFAYELVKRHELPVRKFGKRLLIPRVALEKMLAEGEAE
jgi:excisionase family DNA binding protein